MKKHRAARSIVGSHESPGALDTYLAELEAYPPLAAAEEAEVARLAGDERATDRLVSGNLRFVVAVAKKYRNRGLDLGDLIGAGNEGLLTAARKFDPDRGHKFISYAVHWIRQAILKALAEQSRCVRLPLNRATDLAGLHRASGRLLQRLEREPTEAELAEETGLSVDIVRGLHGLSLADTRTDDDTDENAKRTRELADASSTPLERLLDTEHSEVLARAVGRLSPRTARILRLRFGLGGEQERTMEEIGRMLGISRERVRQLCAKAFAQLRSDCELATAAGRTPAALSCDRLQPLTAKRSRRATLS